MRGRAAVGSEWGGVCEDGYVVDFGDIKKLARALCKELNEHLICPTRSDVLKVSTVEVVRPAPPGAPADAAGGRAPPACAEQVCIECEDGAAFSVPRSDVALIPIVHSTAEELAHYLWIRLVRGYGLRELRARRVVSLSVSVSEAPYQRATFTCELPEEEAALERMEAGPCPQMLPVRGCSERGADVP